MATSNILLLTVIATVLSLTSAVDPIPSTMPPPQCLTNTTGNCHNNSEALKLKIIAILVILVTSAVGVSLPLFSRLLPALKPDRDYFILIKTFASGVILATGYMHLLPDSYDCLTSECLPDHPWKKFPFTTFVTMLSVVFTMMVDSYTTSYHKMKNNNINNNNNNNNNNNPNDVGTLESQDGAERGHGSESTLLRYRVVAQILELGILVHTVVIGLSMGATNNVCAIRPLVLALCFHQFFEGLGLGGCILQAEYGMKTKAIMVFFFSCTTPVGIGLGIGLSNVYNENSPIALIVVGLLNACSTGMLNYMAIVNLLASDFMGTKLQENVKLQTLSYVFVLLGAGGMSVMAIWA